MKQALKRVESELSQKRAERQEQIATRDELKAKISEASDQIDLESEDFKAAEEANKAATSLSDEIDGLVEDQRRILSLMAAEAEAVTAVNTTNGQSSAIERGGEWDSRKILESPGYAAIQQMPLSRSAHIGNVNLGEIVSQDAFAAEIGSTDVAGLIQPDRRGLLPPLFRPLTLLDVFPSGTTTSNLVEYTQVTTMPEVAVEVAEGDEKPEAALAFEDADAPIRTIAAWIKFRKQTLADAPTLRSFVDNALRYDVRRRLETQIIAGDGTGENLTGILETDNVLEPTTTGDSEADKIHNGITAIALANMAASVVILNPLDWEKIRLSRDASGAGAGTGGYLFGSPAQAGDTTVWGLRTVVSVGIPEGTALVCDPAGAMILIREGVNVLVSDSDRDDFTHNRVTVLAEMRAGLVVQRPDAFAVVDLSTGP